MSLAMRIRYADGTSHTPYKDVPDTPVKRRALDRAAWAFLCDPKIVSIRIGTPEELQEKSLAIYAPRISCPSCLSEMIRNVPMDDGEPRRLCVKCKFEWLEGDVAMNIDDLREDIAERTWTTNRTTDRDRLILDLLDERDRLRHALKECEAETRQCGHADVISRIVRGAL